MVEPTRNVSIKDENSIVKEKHNTKKSETPVKTEKLPSGNDTLRVESHKHKKEEESATKSKKKHDKSVTDDKMSKKHKEKKKEKKPSSHAVSDHEKKEKSGASKEAVTELQQRISTLEKQLGEIIDSNMMNGNKQSNKKDPNRLRSSKLRYTPGIALKPEARIIDKASCLTQK